MGITIDNTKRRFKVAIFTSIGLKYEGIVPLNSSQVDELRLALKQKRLLELQTTPMQVVVVSSDVVAALVIEELLVDKVDNDDGILVN